MTATPKPKPCALCPQEARYTVGHEPNAPWVAQPPRDPGWAIWCAVHAQERAASHNAERGVVPQMTMVLA